MDNSVTGAWDKQVSRTTDGLFQTQQHRYMEPMMELSTIKFEHNKVQGKKLSNTPAAYSHAGVQYAKTAHLIEQW